MKAKSLIVIAVAIAAVAPLWWLAVEGRQQVGEVNARIEASEVPDYVQVGTRVYTRSYGEGDSEWASRVGRIVRGEEVLDGQYLCDTLTGCDVPGGEVEVCTYCNASPPSASCIARHAASMAAFCEEFDCTDCG